TVILLSLLLTLAATALSLVAAAHCRGDLWWKCLLLIASLVASKACVDYASSGLENPLSYAIGAVFLAVFLPAAGAGAVGQRHLAVLGLLVSMAFLNRPDSVLLYAPALALAIHRARQLPFGRLAAALGVAALPALLWLLFSLVYYGYPAANT